jgi:hypothetical protein
VYKITPEGTLTTFASVSTVGGINTKLIFDVSGNLYWAVTNHYNGSSYNLTSYVYKITPAGSLTTFASVSTSGGNGTDLIFDVAGNLYWSVSNYHNGSIFNLTSYVYKITPAGSLTTFASVASFGAVGSRLIFDELENLYWAVGNHYNGSSYNTTSYVYKITPGGSLTTFASQATSGSSDTSLIFDTNGNLYWAVNNRYNDSTYVLTSYVYKITSEGTLTTFASRASKGAFGSSLLFDTNGDLYWALTNFYDGSSTVQMSYIHKITPNGTLSIFSSVGTNAGEGTDLIFDTNGNLYWSVINSTLGTTSYIYQISKVTLNNI